MRFAKGVMLHMLKLHDHGFVGRLLELLYLALLSDQVKGLLPRQRSQAPQPWSRLSHLNLAQSESRNKSSPFAAECSQQITKR